MSTATQILPDRYDPVDTEEARVLAAIPDKPRLRRLLQDLETLMLREGYLHFSGGELATRLRCSKSSLYQLAPSLDGVFQLVIRIWLARADDRSWRAYHEAPTWAGRLTGFLNSTPFIASDTSYRFLADLQAFPAGQRIVRSYIKRRQEIVRHILQRGIDEGAFHPVHLRLTAQLFDLAAERLMMPDFLIGAEISVGEAFKEMLHLFEYGFIKDGTVLAT
jgi:AcrR family transcriptional regulator